MEREEQDGCRKKIKEKPGGSYPVYRIPPIQQPR